MKRILFGALSLAALLAFMPATAQANEDGAGAPPMMHDGDMPPPPMMGGEPGEMHRGGPGMHHRMKDMTPEQREAFRAKMKEKFDSLPPEKQAEIKAKMKERHEAMKNMSPEERKEMHKKWREEHGGRGREGGRITHGRTGPAPTEVPGAE